MSPRSRSSGRWRCSSFERAADLFAQGVVDARTVVSDRVPLANYADAIARFRRGEGRKIQVQPALLPAR